MFVKPSGFNTLARDVFESLIAIGNVVWPAVNNWDPAIEVTIGIRAVGLLPAVNLSDTRPPQPVNACVFETLV